MLSATASNVIVDICAGNLEVRLARSDDEVHQSQALRYQVFVNEIGAVPSEELRKYQRDFDEFDEYCDHLLVIEHSGNASRVVGTYRLLRREPMRKLGRFYTQSEFDLTPALQFDGEILELGRSCVHPDYRNRAVMQLLWRGIASYVEYYKIGLMFGCGSLYGADPEKHKAELSYLYHYHLAPPELRIKALPDRYVDMKFLSKDAINAREAFASLPALIKGYLRLGGYVGEGAVMDYEYNTADVGIVVKTDLVTARYAQRYAGTHLKESAVFAPHLTPSDM